MDKCGRSQKTGALRMRQNVHMLVKREAAFVLVPTENGAAGHSFSTPTHRVPHGRGTAAACRGTVWVVSSLSGADCSRACM